MTAARLSAAIRAALGDDIMRERAAALGAQIRAEDGIGRAVAIVNKLSSTAQKTDAV